MKKIKTQCAALALAAAPAVALAGSVAAPRPYVAPSPAQQQQAYDAYRHPFQQAIPQVPPPSPGPQQDSEAPGARRQFYCVAATAKVGDAVRSNAGNPATIRSLNDGAKTCRNPVEPVAAELEYQEPYSPKLEFALPKSYAARTPDDLQRFRGEMFWAHDVDKDIHLHVYSRPRHRGDSADVYARNVATSIVASLDEAKSGDPEHLTINGIPALRFEVEGQAGGASGQRRTYVETVLDSPVELVLVATFTPSAKAVENRPLMQQLAGGVRGIDAPGAALDVPHGPPASAPAADGAVKPSGSPAP